MKTWFVRARLTLFFMLVALLVLPSIALAQEDATPVPVDVASSLELAATWLQAQQAEDGGWIGFSGVSDVGATIDAVFALVSIANTGVEVDLSKAQTYLETNGDNYAKTGTGQAAKLTLAAVALGQDGRNFAGIDPFELAVEDYDASLKLYGTGVYDTALVMLAYASLNEELPGTLIDSLRNLQLADGSWAFDGTTTVGNGDTNTTAIVIQGLVALGETEGDLILHGIEYLQAWQLPQGFPFQPGPGAAADANSTGIVVQALIAAGEDPTAQEWLNVYRSLFAFQNESGSFSYLLEPKSDNLFATVQVIPAIAEQPFPIRVGEAGATPVALPTCTVAELEATPVTDEELLCAA